MTANTIKIAVCTLIGAVGGFIANLFGGWTDDLKTLVILMAIDFVMGLVVAGVFKKSNKSETGAIESKAGWKGLCRKGATLLVVLIAHRLDIALAINFVRTATIIGYITNELISIVENAGLMGVPLPSVITKSIEILKNRTDDHNEIGSGAEIIEKLIYPVKNARITQGYHKGSSHYGHSHSSDGIIDYSLDDGEKDTGCNDYIYAPCTLRIVEIYTSGTNTLWWESVNKVLLANGKLAYVCGYIIHCPDSSLKKLKVGQIIKQGEKIAQEGMDGATGYHFHHAVALGRCKKFAGCPRPWKKNAAGYYVLTSTEGAIKPELAYWMNTKFTKIFDGFGYAWRKTTTSTITDGKYANGTYTVTTDVLNVRSGPGTEFDKLSFDKLTVNAQKQIKQLNKNRTATGLVKGCTCTVSETIGTWGKIPSGWICLDYCKKNK